MPAVSATDIAVAKARPIAEIVGAVLPLNRGDFALCPFHDERSPSLHVWRKGNVFRCFGCGAAGDTIEFVRRYRGIDFQAAVHELSRCGSSLGAPKTARQGASPPLIAEPFSRILDLWNSATSPGIAEFYLWTRGLAQKRLPEALRGHPAVWCSEARQRRPAVLAALTGPTGAVVAVQRIWVEQTLVYDGHTEHLKGSRCLDLAAGKKTWGSTGSSAVRLAGGGWVIGIAEGVESALAAASLFKLPVWASCGASRLGSIELPKGTEHVVIFADNGSAGETAAAKAESIYRRRGYGAQIVFPEMPCSDFAEQVMR